MIIDKNKLSEILEQVQMRDETNFSRSSFEYKTKLLFKENNGIEFFRYRIDLDNLKFIEP